ncbi:SDR family NAD(P)-dependent oxidoreductase [Candidatus Dependentiae bacterium]
MKKMLIFIFIVLVVATVFDREKINEKTKTCLVTGASSGIGCELARKMIKKGWKVIGIARRQEKLKKLKQEFGHKFIPYKCDVGDLNQIIKTSELIKKQLLKPTLFFLNAGVGESEFKFNPLIKQHKKIFNTNYFGAVAWIDEWIKDVKKYGGGTFVAISSVTALFAMPGSSGYSSSKAALNSCFSALRLQYYDEGIKFVTVMPGPVDTDMLKSTKPLPYTHQADEEAKYIIKEVFKGKTQIEPAWFYSILCRILSWLPDNLTLRIIK